MDSTLSIVIAALSSLCCCLGFVLFVLFLVGFLFLRKRGQKAATPVEAVRAGADQVSRAFVRTNKTREQLYAEEEEEERKNRGR
jgi:hypothetical protein